MNTLAARYLTILLLLLASPFPLLAQTKILVLGGSQGIIASEAAFPATNVAAHLQEILRGDEQIGQSATVQARDTYQTKYLYGTQMSRSLMTWFYWPDTYDSNQALLTQKWDSIVLMDDPYVQSRTPQFHFEGIRAITETARSGTNEPLVAMLWSSGTTSIENFAEGAYRAADGLGLKVAPAGYAWSRLDPALKDSGVRPTSRGAYLTAATIYSQLYRRSASASSYRPAGVSDTDAVAIADAAWQTVLQEEGRSHYTGAYSGPTRMAGNKRRLLEIDIPGFSASSSLAGSLGYVSDIAKKRKGNTLSYMEGVVGVQQNIGHAVDFAWSYLVAPDAIDPTLWKNHVICDYKWHPEDPFMMRLTLDQVITDIMGVGQGTPYSSSDEITPALIAKGALYFPHRLMWTKLRIQAPDVAYVGSDQSHPSEAMFSALATAAYTSVTGRCPDLVEPTKGTVDWERWIGRKIAYETVTQISTFRQRVPGFDVVPTNSTARLSSTTSETVGIRFFYPPTSNVTVQIGADKAGVVNISPSTLTFTPDNYNQVQNVSVTLANGYTDKGRVKFNFTTTCADEVFNGLFDQQEYATNAALPVVYDLSVNLAAGTGATNFTPTSNAGDAAGYGAVAAWQIINPPVYGKTTGTPPNYAYTPTFAGVDDVLTFKCYDDLGQISNLATVTFTGYVDPQAAITLTYDSNPAASGISYSSNNWNSTLNTWWDGSKNVLYTPGANAVFDNPTGINGTVTVDANMAANTLLFRPILSGSYGYTFMMWSNTLSIMTAQGIAAYADVNVKGALSVTADQTWTIASGKTFYMGGNGAGAPAIRIGSNHLTLAGSGTFAFNSGCCEIPSSSGTLTISKETTFQAVTTSGFYALYASGGALTLDGDGTFIVGRASRTSLNAAGSVLYGSVKLGMTGGTIILSNTYSGGSASNMYSFDTYSAPCKAWFNIPEFNGMNIHNLSKIMCDGLIGSGVIYSDMAQTTTFTLGNNNTSRDGGITPGVAVFSGSLLGNQYWNLSKVGLGTQVMEGPIPGMGTVSVQAGTLVLSNTANTFSGKITISGGTLEIKGIANIGASSSCAGAPTSGTSGQIDIGSSGTSGTLRFTGTVDCSTDRTINMAGTTGGATLDNSSLANSRLVFSGSFTAKGNGGKNLVLAGYSTADNEIQAAIVNSTGTTSVVKSGPGKWILSGSNTYTGSTSVDGGTLVIGRATLPDGADVKISSNAQFALNFTGSDTVRRLVIDGVPQPVGTWGSLTSNATYKTALITGPGVLNVTQTSAFVSWAVGQGLDGTPGRESAFAADPDGDRIPNGLEWALGGQPSVANSSLWNAQMDATNLTVDFNRVDASESSTKLVAQWSTDLQTWNEITIGAASAGPDVNGATVAVVENGTAADKVTVTIPRNNAPKMFVRLKIMEL